MPGTLNPPKSGARLVIAAVLIGLGVFWVSDALHTPEHHTRRTLPHPFAAAPAGAPVKSPPVSTTTTAATTATTTGGGDIPLRVLIGRLEIDAPVVPVGSQAGAVAVPRRATTLGWWIGGSAPGSAVGTTVIVGHVDSAHTGPGALFHLDSVRASDRIDVRLSGGRRQAYRVDSLTVLAKRHGLPGSLFAADGPPRLVLITCGGPFDSSTRSYEDNIVVTASPR